MGLVKNKMVWVGAAVMIVAMLILGVAMMGSVLSAGPKQLPVALVMLDEGGQLPDGNSMLVGNRLQSQLLTNGQLPVQWELVATELDARNGMRDKKYYGALVLPVDLSASVLSQMSPDPQPAQVTLLINEGMHPQAAAAVKQMLGQVMNGVSVELSRQVLGMIGQQSQQIPVRTAEGLLQLIKVQEETLHPVGDNHAGGSASGMLTQLMWIGALVISVFLFLAQRSAANTGASRWSSVSLRVLLGLFMMGAASALLVWMAGSWYGMELNDIGKIWLFLWLAGAAFHLLQSSLLSWLGMPAMGLLVLLLFFSMPVINLAPEFLPQATRDLLYSWTPFRFAVEGLREQLYFSESVTSAISVLWWIAGVSLIVLLASGMKRGVAPAPTAKTG